MSAVFTGNGLGLFSGSLGQVGGGTGGTRASQGQDNQYVNVANGNLVLQAQDEVLMFRGLGIGQVRTYNSLGIASEVGADAWLTGFERRLTLLSGLMNGDGSVLRRFTGDGGYQDFTFVEFGRYRSTTGSGADDTLELTFSSGMAWAYTEGSSGRQEIYGEPDDFTAAGRLLSIIDPHSDEFDPIRWDVIYDESSRVSEVRVHDGGSTGDALLFTYDGSGRVSGVSTRENGVVRGQVGYEYDVAGRLSAVLVDLTSSDGVGDDDSWDAATATNNDGYLFRTQYTYVDATSLRIAQVRTSDGTLTSFTYDGSGRVATVTRGDTNANDADGVGQTLTYTYASGRTDVTDSTGRTWSYSYDAKGQLTQVQTPAIAGQRDLSDYSYDADGNVTRIRTSRAGVTLSQSDYSYDGNGNLLWQWETVAPATGTAARAVQRTYTATNQLASQTIYSGLDSDGIGAAVPTGGMTTRYVYDSQDRLRFVVDPLGAVRELEYAQDGNGIGQVSTTRQYLAAGYGGAVTLNDLVGWSSGQRGSSSLVVTSYDLNGRLAQTRAFATVDASGNGVDDDSAQVTDYVYDAQGLLRQQIQRRSSTVATGDGRDTAQATSYVYDGLGRLLSEVVTQQVGVGAVSTLRTTTLAYTDSGMAVRATIEGGVASDGSTANDLLRVQVRNAAGQVVSVAESAVAGGATRSTQNYYDSAGRLRASQDAGGARTYYFYDEEGAQSGLVDATGAVTTFSRNALGQIASTARFATLVNTTTWVSGGSVVPTDINAVKPAVDPGDRTSTATYDAEGNVLTQVDADGGITSYSYDGAGRLLQTKVTDAAQTVATARVTRYVYDDASQMVGQLDSGGYLTEYGYDRAGRRIRTTAYVNATAEAQRASGTLAQLRPTIHAADQVTRVFHDGRGNAIATIDAEGYLTEFIFDEARNERAVRAYATRLTGLSGSETLVALKTLAGATARETRRSFDALGNLTLEVNAEGTVTRYSYDAQGRLLKSEAAQGTSEVRENNRRYDVFGNLVGELAGEGSTRLLGGMSESQLDAVYAQYGVRHSYDALGRRIESIDAEGNKTWYFYDSAGRLTQTARGVLDGSGVRNAQVEVTETRYTAFGEVRDTTAYTGRLTIAVPGDRASVASVMTTLAYLAASDNRTQYTYNKRGLVASTTDAGGVLSKLSYNAWGERTRLEAAFGTSAASVTDFAYDNRGLLLSRTDGVGTAVVRSASQTYDAFGRVQTSTDARGVVTTLGYDRLGRQLTQTRAVQGRAETITTAYDAFNRIVSTIDAAGHTTSFAYSDAARSMTVTTPEGVAVTTVHDRHGATLTVSGGGQDATYTYNKDGQLLSAANGLGQATTNEYNARGLLAATVDATGRRMELQYDAAGRVITRTEDAGAGKLNLATSYRYDGQGRQLQVTDASGRVVAFTYDVQGRLLEQARDPAGINLRTRYSYDAQGHQISVVEGYGTAAARTTHYAYDALGRRTSETVDPAGLALTTSYVYDKNDNVIRRTDAAGKVTRYYYDEGNRLVYSVDPLGAMTRNWYDVNGRVSATRTFSQATDAGTLTDATTLAHLDARLTWLSTDRGQYLVHDKDGRLRYVVDIGGALEQRFFDAANRLVGTRRYAASYSPSAAVLDKLFAGTALPADIAPSANDTRDETSYNIYDAAGRLRLTFDGLGNAQETIYDAAGRAVAAKRYANAMASGSLAAQKAAALAGTATASGVLATITGAPSRDMVGYQVFDGAGRVKYTIDAAGAVTEAMYDGAGNRVGSRAFALTIALDATITAGNANVSNIAARITSAIQNDIRNSEQYTILDAAGRVTDTIMIDRDKAGVRTGYVTQATWDESGNLVSRVQPQNTISEAKFAANLGALQAGTVRRADITSWLGTITASRITRTVSDAAGRPRFVLVLQSSGAYQVTERRYDAMGRTVAEVAYGVSVPAATTMTVAAIQTALTNAGGNDANNQRITRYVFNGNGQVRYVIDDLGDVTERRYDGLGRLTESRAYEATIPEATGATEATVQAALAGKTSRNTRYQYDAGGRLLSTTDALNQVESYTYDAIGRRETRKDRTGAIWTFAYDSAGRITSETSPTVIVATVAANGTVTTTSRALVTRSTYDALGQLLNRTENADTTDARTTTFDYDSRGNQIRTTFPDAFAINESTGELQATGQMPTLEVTYDAFGHAVVQKDTLGNYSYKSYDALGQLIYEIDAEGFATAYGYDAFGQQQTVTRHAARANTAAVPGWIAGQALTEAQLGASGIIVANGTADRQLTIAYDLAGRKTSVSQTAVTYYDVGGVLRAAESPTTQFSYNAYGDMVKESVLLHGTPGINASWADTYHYYDALGRNELSVDAEGYATRTEYNANGEVTRSTQYARAISTQGLTTTTPPSDPPSGDAVTGFDRTTRWTYDALGRKSSETAVRRYQRADGTTGLRDLRSDYGYDGEGRLTSVRADEVGTTTTVYDAMGRVVSILEPTRDVLAGNAESLLLQSTANTLASDLHDRVSPYTTLLYDAFGNAVQTRRFANGWVEGAPSAVADDSRDQIQVTRYDRQGRAVMTRNAEGHVVYSAFDSADHLVHRWYALAGSGAIGNDVVHARYTYDKAGRQITSTQTRNAATDLAESVEYNGFGEIVRKTSAGLAGELTYTYDQAGRMLTSSEGGAVRQLGYNLAGHQVRQQQKAFVSAVQGAIDVVTFSVTDRLGRATKTWLPSYNATLSTTSAVLQQWDRWGNVVQIIDARGYQTNYQYNDFNQLVRDERPLAEVVSETGARTWVRPVNQWFYDALGRLVATRDANGNLRSNVYDDAGRLVRTIDALGNSTLYAYDVFGNQRMSQNPLGYVTYKLYDRENRVVAMGDYLPDAAGATRTRPTAQQQYLLNGNGDRVWVTDALGYKVLYDYDSRGQLIRSQTAMGVVTNYAYDVQGRKVSEATLTAGGSLSWAYDIHGRLVDHDNLSGRDSNYEYNADSGQLSRETASGGGPAASGKSMEYYPNGQIKRIVEDAGNIYYYEYDAAGNRTLEEVTTVDAGGKPVHTYTKTWYDSQNRIMRVVQNDGLDNPVFDLTYEYDAVGNRRHVRTRSGYGPDSVDMQAGGSPPVVVGQVADRTVRKGVTSSFQLLFSDTFRDADQDRLSMVAKLADGSNLPTWLVPSINTETGEITFTATPPAGMADTDYNVQLRAWETGSDPNLYVQETFLLRVRTNTAPQLIDSGVAEFKAKSQAGPWGIEFDAASFFRDQDVGDVLRLSVDSVSPMPAWLTVDPGNPFVVRLSGTPTGTETFTVLLRATDQNGASVVKTIRIATAPNAGPGVVGSPSGGDATPGRSYVWTRPLSSLFQDPNGDALQVTATGMPSWMTFTYLDDQGVPEIRLDGHVPTSEVEGRVYTITFRAVDPDGLVSTTTVNVTVHANRAPAVRYPSGWTLPSIRVGDTVDSTVNVATLFSDAENDAITVEALNVPSWMTATIDQEAGTIRFQGRPTTNAQAGEITVQVRGWDIGGLSSLAPVKLHVGPDYSPVRSSVPLPDYTASIGRPVNFTLPSGMFTEADGDGITLSAGVVYETSEYLDTIPPQTVYYVNAGEWPSWLSFNPATGQFTGTVPAGTAPGKFVVRISARDGRGNYNVESGRVGASNINYDCDITFNVQPFQNHVPIYNGTLPSRTINHGAPVDFPMPAGAFTEPDGDAMTYTAMVRGPGYFEYVNTSSDPMEPFWEQVWREGPWNDISSIGLSIDANTGRITGTPTNLRELSFEAIILARDPQTTVASGSFTFNVQNAAPVAPAIPNQAAPAGQAWTYTIPPFTDLNNETLTYVVSGMPGWMTFNPATRQIGGTSGPVGSWTLTVRATDPQGAFATQTFAVSTPNAWPSVINAMPDQAVGRRLPFSYRIPDGTFADANGDSLTITVAGLPAGFSYDASTRTISGTTTTLGTSTITVTANDNRGGTASDSFVLTVTNSPPVYNNNLPSRAAQVNEQVNWPLPGGAFSDANGDPLTYTIMVEYPWHMEYYWDASDNAWLMRDVPAQWQTSYNLAINPSTGTITGPMPAFTQPVHPVTGAGGGFLDHFRIKVIASDGNSSVEGIFDAQTNFLPTGSVTNRTIKSGLATSFTLNAFSDANNDTLSYSMSGLPAGMSFNAGNLTVSGTAAAGTYTVTLTVNDGKGGVVSKSFTLTVTANNNPVPPSFSPLPLQVGTAVGVNFPSFSDPDGDPVTYGIAGLPPGLWFDANSRVIGGTPSAAGSYGVTVYAYDNRGGSSSLYFVYNVSPAPIPNRAPQVSNQPASPAAHFYSTNRFPTPLSGFTLPVNTFTDPDNNPLTYAVIQKPAFLSYTFIPGSGHAFEGRNNDSRSWAQHTIVIRATDPSGAWVDVTFYVTSEYYYWTPGGPVEPVAPRSEPMVFDMGVALAPEGTQFVAGGGAVQTMAAGTTVPIEVKDYWYTYDAENRIRINNGKLVDTANGKQIQLETYDYDSYLLSYDAAGNAVSRTSYRGGTTYWVDRSVYDLRGNRVTEFHTDVLKDDQLNSGGVRKRMTYDNAGKLTQTLSYFDSGAYWDHTSGPGEYYEFYDRYYYGGWLSASEVIGYDQDGRTVYQENRYRRPQDNSWVMYADDTGGRQSTDIGVLDMQSRTDYTQYDSAGRLKAYEFKNFHGNDYRHRYTVTYVGWESFQQASVTGVAVEGTGYLPTTNTLTYDTMGRLVSQREKSQMQGGQIDDRMRYYAYNGEGKVLTRREGTINTSGVFEQDATYGRLNYMYVHAAGQQIAELKEGFVTAQGRSLPQVQSLAGKAVYSAGGGKVTALPGETLRDMSTRIYGTDQLWYVLAQANGLSDPDKEVASGSLLEAPDVSVNRNDANTFKPYNPAEAIGSTTPSLPYIQPPPKQSCDVMATIMIIIVAVAVSVATWGALSGPAMTALGSTLAGGVAAGAVAGAVAGAAASAASGALGSFMGTSSFSWKSVAAGAITGAITGGIAATYGSAGSALKDGAAGALKAVGIAASTAVGGYAGQKVMNVDNGFSWKSIAISTVANLAGGYAGNKAGDTPLIQGLAAGATSGMVSGVLHRLAGDGNIDYGLVAADAFSSALSQAWGARQDSAMAKRDRDSRMLDEAAWNDGNPFNGGVVTADPSVGGDSKAPHYGEGYDSFFPQDPPGMHRDSDANNASEFGLRADGGYDAEKFNKFLVEQSARNGSRIAIQDLNGDGVYSPNDLRTLEIDGERALRSQAEIYGDVKHGNEIDFSRQVEKITTLEAVEAVAVMPADIEVSVSVEPPAIENLYSPRVGAYEQAFREYDAGFSDSSASWDARLLGAVGATATFVPMLADSLISGFYNAPNNAALAGQSVAKAGMLTGPDSHIAYLEAVHYGATAILGVGDVATLGQGALISQARSVPNRAALGELADVPRSTIAANNAPPSQSAVRARIEANIAQTRAGNAASSFDKFVQTEGRLYEQLEIWPPNLGRIGPVQVIDLQPGAIIDRFGMPVGGRFLSPQGTPFSARALPSTYEAKKPYFMYEVIKPIPGVTQSRALPWFGQSGMGVQYELPRGVNYLDPNNGYVRVKYHEP